MRREIGLKLALVLPLLYVSGCVAPTEIVSTKAERILVEPKRVFLIIDIGDDFGQEFFDSFNRKMDSIVKDCGAQLSISQVKPLELDQSTHTTLMKAFRPDALLLLGKSGSVHKVYQGGTPLLYNVSYDVRLFEQPANVPVWRAGVTFFRGGTVIPLKKRGEALAVEITNKMKQDKIFRSCEVIKLEP